MIEALLVVIVALVGITVLQIVLLAERQEEIKKRENAFRVVVDSYLAPLGYEVTPSGDWSQLKVGIPKERGDAGESTDH
jgi:hypothetical protein